MYECQPTSSSDQVFTPNIPDLYFDHTDAAAFRTGDGANLTTVTGPGGRTTLIYTTPPESVCSGTVTAIQYCYHTTINSPRNFLRFLSFSRNGLVITVKSARNIVGRAIPQDNVCSDYPGSNGHRICCDTTNLAVNSQFQIPSNFTFGVILLNNNDVRPLAFSGTTDMKYQFPHFVTRLPSNPPTGSTFTLNEGDYQSDRYLLLMRYN